MRWIDLSQQGVRVVLVKDVLDTPILAIQGGRAQRQLQSALQAAGFQKNRNGEWLMVIDPPDGQRIDAALASLRENVRESSWSDYVAVDDVFPGLSERIGTPSATPEEEALYVHFNTPGRLETAPVRDARPASAALSEAQLDRQGAPFAFDGPAGSGGVGDRPGNAVQSGSAAAPTAQTAAAETAGVQGLPGEGAPGGADTGAVPDNRRRGRGRPRVLKQDQSIAAPGAPTADPSVTVVGEDHEPAAAAIPESADQSMGEAPVQIGQPAPTQDVSTAADALLERELADATQEPVAARARRVVDAQPILDETPEPLTLEAKRLAGLAMMPLVARLMREKREIEAKGGQFNPELSPEEIALLARYKGKEAPETPRAIFDNAQGRLASDLAQQFINVAKSWKLPEEMDPSPEEMRVYGVDGFEDRAKDVTYASRNIVYHNRISVYEMTDGFANALWEIAQRAGFDGGRVLLPNCGVGQLSRQRPEGVPITATLLPSEPLAHEIAKVLHPEDTVVGGLYHRTILPSGYYDLAVGVNHTSEALIRLINNDNAPLVRDEALIAEADTPPLNEAQHFVYKSLQCLRSGGLGIFAVRSDMFMKSGSQYARAAKVRVNQTAELVSYLRVSGEAVRGMIAMTETSGVTDNHSGYMASGDSYDLLVLRKRPELLDREVSEKGVDEWIENVPLIGQFGIRHPYFVDDRHYADIHADALQELRDEMVQNVPQGVLLPRDVEPDHMPGTDLVLADVPAAGAQPAIYEGSYVLINDGIDVGVMNNGQVQAYDAPARQTEVLRLMIPVRDSIAEVLRVQMESTNDDRLRTEQRRLRAAYDAFVDRFGPISKPSNVEIFSDEPGLPQLLALENYDMENGTATPTDFFTERVVGAPRLIERAESATEALALCMGRCGYVSPPLLTALTRRPWSELAKELQESVFMDPLEGRWVTRDQYLSGNVRAKLRSAVVAAAIDQELFGPNVPALESVQPKDVAPEEIDFQFGTPWVPMLDYKRFIGQTVGMNLAEVDKGITLNYDQMGARWTLTFDEAKCSTRALLDWRTETKDAADIMQATLNSKSIRVELKDQDKPEVKITNHVETAQAHMLQERLRDSFQRWGLENPLRAERLARVYNERVNAYRDRKYNGDYLRFEQLSPLRMPMGHQRDTIARGIEDGNVLIAHAVGSGKSFALAGIAMESKRMGLHRKSGILVPKATVNQTAAEIIKFYPSAKVLVGDGISARSPESVRRFVSRAAMDNWDIIVMTHETCKAIPLSAKAQIKILQRQVNENEKERSLTSDAFFFAHINRLQRKIEALSLLAEAQAEDGSEAYGFERMGIDQLLVDEAHRFKNVDVRTKMNVLGIGNLGSDLARDMQAKVSHVRSVNGYRRGIVFASATPICNSIAEMYTMMTYVNPNVLRSMNIRHFDAWASTFGRVQSLIEQKPAGDGWQIRDRFIRFQNVPEMVRAFRAIADVRMDDDLPEIRNARPQMTHDLVVSPRDPIDEAILKALEIRARSLEAKKPFWRKDGVIVLMSDLSRAMLDRRIINPRFPENERSIVQQTAERCLKHYNEERDRLGTQLIFCDQGIHGKEFSIYEALRERMVEMGIPREQIALINEHQKPHEQHKLQTRVNAGKIRFVIGSSSRLGIGRNVQRLVKAMHHMDMPLRPDMLEQRIGRGWRPGNLYLDAGIVNYVYAKSGQTRRFEILQNKIMPIKQALRNPDNAERRVQEELDVTLGEIQAELTNNPLLKQKVQLDAELRNLDLLRRAHAREQAVNAQLAQKLKGEADRLEANFGAIVEDAAVADAWFTNYRAQVHAAAVAEEQREADERAAREAAKAAAKAQREAEKLAEKDRKAAARVAAAGTVAVAEGEPVAVPAVGASEATVGAGIALDLTPDNGAHRPANDASSVMPAGALDEPQNPAPTEPSATTTPAIKAEPIVIADSGFSMTVAGHTYTSRKAAGFELLHIMNKVSLSDPNLHRLGEFAGFEIKYRGPCFDDMGAQDFGKGLFDFGGGAGSNRSGTGAARQGLGDSWGTLYLVRGDHYAFAATGNPLANVLEMINILKTRPESIRNLDVKLKRAKEEAKDYAAKAAEPFAQEAAWVRAQERRVRIDAELLQHQGAIDEEAEARLLEPLRGMSMASGRPLHPEELAQWNDADEAIEDAKEADDAEVAEILAAGDAGEQRYNQQLPDQIRAIQARVNQPEEFAAP